MKENKKSMWLAVMTLVVALFISLTPARATDAAEEECEDSQRISSYSPAVVPATNQTPEKEESCDEGYGVWRSDLRRF